MKYIKHRNYGGYKLRFHCEIYAQAFFCVTNNQLLIRNAFPIKSSNYDRQTAHFLSF